MADILVIGAGISGLSSAWFLKQKGHRVRVIEAAPRGGGCLQSAHPGDFLVEGGPNSTLDRGTALAELTRDVGLAGEVVEANQAARRRYIVKDGRLLPLPGGPGAFIRTPLFSAAAKLRLLLEPFHGRAKGEESVAEFVRRRLGPEFLDWAVDPFVSGVYAGDPDRLSVRSATAKIYALEAEYGSLFVGAVMRLLRGRASGPTPTGRLIAFREGMQALPDAVTAALDGAVHFGKPVRGLSPHPGGWQVETDGERYEAERVVLAVPAYHAAELLSPLDPELAEPMAQINYPPVASVALGFGREQVGHPLDGFGALIPRRLGIETLGALFSSTLFPGRAPEGKVLLTAFIGGARNPAVGQRDEGELAAKVLEDLRPLLGIDGEPVFSQVTLWPRAIPQYELGHPDRIARIDRALLRWPGLHLRANWRDGISVGDCVTMAKALAEAVGPAERH